MLSRIIFRIDYCTYQSHVFDHKPEKVAIIAVGETKEALCGACLAMLSRECFRHKETLRERDARVRLDALWGRR